MKSRVVLFSILGALALGACKPGGAAKAKPVAAPITVPLSTVAEGPAAERLTLTGTVTAEESSRVAADVPGKVLAVLVTRGSVVKAGDPLIRLDTRNAALTAREAKANLEAARAQRTLAEDECGRAKTLYDKGAITQSQYERERTSCTAAMQQVAAAEARTQMISKSISDGLVRAPFAGVVSAELVGPGEFVGPGTPLVHLVDVEPLHVELAVPEFAVPSLTAGQAVAVSSIAVPGRSFAGVVTRRGAEINAMSRAMTVEATLEAGTTLVPGMFVKAEVALPATPRPLVPRTAVIRKGKTYRVFRAVDGRLVETIVQLASPADADPIAIRSGLVVGDRVVTTPDAQTLDGVRVVM